MAIGGTNYGRLRWRQGTVAALTAANPVLANGEATSSYVGVDPVVKVGDGVRAWVDLPNIAGAAGVGAFADLTDVNLSTLADGDVATYDGDSGLWINAPAGGGGGGGPVGFGQAYPTGITASTALGGGSAVATSWDDADGLIVPGSFGWGFAAEGWYQVAVMIMAGFTDAIPSCLRVTLQTYDLAEVFGDFPILPAPAAGSASLGTTTSRSLPGVIATLTSPVFHQGDSGETGTNACQIRAGWDDEAALMVSATGGLARFAMRADITRIA